MTKKIIFVAIVIFGLFLTACNETTEDIDENGVVEDEAEEEEEMAEEAKELAKEYLRNTPTFKERGGNNLRIVETKEKEGKVEVVASFETEFAGYGSLECEIITAPKETHHEAVLLVEGKEVVEAMLNEEYDIVAKERLVEVTEEEIKDQKEIINSKREREEDSLLEGEELQKEARERIMRVAVRDILFEEWSITISQDEVEEEILQIMEEGGWKDAGIETVDAFFEYQQEKRNYSQQEIVQDIILDLGMSELVREKLDVGRIEILEEEIKEAQEQIEEKAGEDIAFEEVEEALFGRRLSEIIIGELERKREKSVLLVDGIVVDPDVELEEDPIEID